MCRLAVGIVYLYEVLFLVKSWAVSSVQLTYVTWKLQGRRRFLKMSKAQSLPLQLSWGHRRKTDWCAERDGLWECRRKQWFRLLSLLSSGLSLLCTLLLQACQKPTSGLWTAHIRWTSLVLIIRFLAGLSFLKPSPVSCPSLHVLGSHRPLFVGSSSFSNLSVLGLAIPRTLFSTLSRGFKCWLYSDSGGSF